MSVESTISRRQFLKRAAFVGTAFAAPYVVASSVLGKDGAVAPSERIGMGFIGVGHQGGGHFAGGAWTYLPGGYLGRPDVQVLAVCDVRRERRQWALETAEKRYTERFGKGRYKGITGYVDFRELLGRDDIDAVLIASPIHWHALMTAMAAKAGKDVYCEKPTALTIREGQAMVEAVRRYGRVFQAGTQQRSEYGGKFRMACDLVRSGHIGKLKCVYAYQGGGGFSPGGKYSGTGRPIPDGFDWDLFLGPVPWRPYEGHAGAHDFGWGDINWGQHHYDIVQWGLGADRTGPVEIKVEDGRVVYRYESGVIVYGSPPPGQSWQPGGACFVGTEGKVVVHRDTFSTDPPELARQPLDPEDDRLCHSDSHSGNFLECVRTRQPTICYVETAHRAMSIILLGGIAMKLGRPLEWDPQREQFANAPDADCMLSVAKREPWRV